MTTDLLIPQGGWAETERERLPAPPVAERGMAFRALSRLSGWFGRPHLPAIFPVFNINPRLFWAWLFFASRLMPYGRLPGATREKLILRTAWNCRSRYEWGQHLEIGLRLGVTDEEVVALALAPETLSPLDAALMRACDELCRQKLVSEATWNALAEHYPKSQLIEIMILVGHYEMVAGFLINAGIRLEPEIEAELDAFHQRVAGIISGRT
jgi:alkylhydroperoxidase family enzyme